MAVDARRLARSYGPALGIAALAIGIAWAFAITVLRHTQPMGLPLDDSYIYLTYAKQFGRGEPFTYFPGGGYSAGSTSVVWPMLLAPFWTLGARGHVLVWVSYLMCSAFYAATAMGVWRIVNRVAGGGAPAVLAAVVVLGIAPFAWTALSGMEVAFASALLVATIALLLDQPATGPPSRRLVACLAASSLSRPEATLIVLGVIGVAALGRLRRRELGAAAWWLSPLLAPLAWVVANKLLAGNLFPNTGVAKSHFYLPGFDWTYWLDAVTSLSGKLLHGLFWERNGPLVWPKLFALGWLVGAVRVVLWARRERRLLAGAVIVTAPVILLFAVVASSGLWAFQNYRYIAPAFPLLAISLGCALAPPRTRSWLVVPIVAAAITVIVLAVPPVLGALRLEPAPRWSASHVAAALAALVAAGAGVIAVRHPHRHARWAALPASLIVGFVTVRGIELLISDPHPLGARILILVALIAATAVTRWLRREPSLATIGVAGLGVLVLATWLLAGLEPALAIMPAFAVVLGIARRPDLRGLAAGVVWALGVAMLVAGRWWRFEPALHLLPAFAILAGATLGARFTLRRAWLATALVTFALFARAAQPGLAADAKLFAQGAMDTNTQVVAIGHYLHRKLPTANVLFHDAGAIAYYGDGRVYDMLGLVTNHQAGIANHGAGSRFEFLEALPPERRFTHFAYYPAWLGTSELYGDVILQTPLRPAFEKRRLVGDSDMQILVASWDHVGTGERLLVPQEGWRMVDRIDVADLASERAHGWSGALGRRKVGDPTARWSFVHREVAGQGLVLDGGRTIRGGRERFSITVDPTRPTRLVLRTGGQRSYPFHDALETPVTLRVLDGTRELTTVTLPAPRGPLHEVALDVPAGVRAVQISATGAYRAFHWFVLQR